jgi:hypothetical protein
MQIDVDAAGRMCGISIEHASHIKTEYPHP